MASQSLSEYERRRLENIKRNDEMMASLKLQTIALCLSKRNRVEPKYVHPSEKKPKSETPKVIRRSLRTQGISPDEKTAKGVEDDLVPLVSSPVDGTPAFSALKMESFSMQEAYVGSFSTQSLTDSIKGMSGNAQLQGSVQREVEGNGVSMFDGEVDGNGVSFDLRLMKLKEENVARVMTRMILNVKFFPCVDKRMVVAGNDIGNVVFWDVDRERGEDEDDDGIYLYRPHSRLVSGILIQPFSLSKVVSSSYDGCIRLMDVEKESFDLVYSCNDTIFCLTQQPHDAESLYFGEGHGLLNGWDVRIGKSSNSWMLHDSRINTIDFNPNSTNLMATSSTDGTARIWDLRCIDAAGSKYLNMVEHEGSVHSAYFSPSGSSLATTSLANKVGILSGVDFKDTSMIYHCNQNDAGHSYFRAIWGWDDSYLYIGNRKRAVDVISTLDKKTVTLKSSLISAIPYRFAAHPYNVGTLAAATSGGQIYVWTSR